MRLPLVPPLLTIALAVAGCTTSVQNADYSSFHNWSRAKKSRITWELFDRREFAKPEHKPICRELLATQGRFADANADGFTLGAMQCVEDYGWGDCKDLIQRVYDRPNSIWMHEGSFRCLRALAGRPVDPAIVKHRQTIKAAGYCQSEVTDEALEAAKRELISSPDQEAVLVYLMTVAGWDSGKGGTLRGRIAAVDVIKTIDRSLVVAATQKLQGNSYVDWLVERLKSDIEATAAGD